MRGKQHDKETVYKIMLSVFNTGNFSETARQLKLSPDTVEDIYKRNIEKPEFTRLHREKQDEFIGKVDAIYFMKDWEKARGCKIEHQVAVEYGKKVYYESVE